MKAGKFESTVTLLLLCKIALQYHQQPRETQAQNCLLGIYFVALHTVKERKNEEDDDDDDEEEECSASW